MRFQDYKYLGYGFGVGTLISGLLLVGIFSLPSSSIHVFISTTATSTQPAHSPTIWISPTAILLPASTVTPIILPSVTSPPSRTATLAATELMIARGEIVVTGPLTREVQVRLYESSITFIARSSKQTRVLSSLINLEPFSDPSTICGPLSIAILQRADLMRQDMIPYDFFLLNPDLPKDRMLVNMAFPQETYADSRYKVRLDDFNWKKDPLMPGDFLYIYSGEQGNFEHMLVVNRVDAAGRAYSVTNFNTEDGFIIDETLLYDPHQPLTGIFHQWTKRGKQVLGSTGFAGFERWRLSD